MIGFGTGKFLFEKGGGATGSQGSNGHSFLRQFLPMSNLLILETIVEKVVAEEL